jgi:hypothetical protein
MISPNPREPTMQKLTVNYVTDSPYLAEHRTTAFQGHTVETRYNGYFTEVWADGVKRQEFVSETVRSTRLDEV